MGSWTLGDAQAFNIYPACGGEEHWNPLLFEEGGSCHGLAFA